MASHSHSGGPTAFRRNPSIAMTLSRPLRPNPQRASPGWPRVYQRHNDHRRGQNDPTRGPGTIISTTGTQGYACLPGQGKHAITFPSWRHRPEAMSMDRINAFPQRQMWLHWENSIQWHHDPINDMFKLSYYQVQLKVKVIGVMICHANAIIKHASLII